MHSLFDLLAGNQVLERDAADAMAALGVLTAAEWDWSQPFDQARAAATMARLGPDRHWTRPPTAAMRMAYRVPELVAAWHLSFVDDDRPARLMMRPAGMRMHRIAIPIELSDSEITRVEMSELLRWATLFNEPDPNSSDDFDWSDIWPAERYKDIVLGSIRPANTFDDRDWDGISPRPDDFQRTAETTLETRITGADAPPAHEADRNLDLALLADHYSPGDRVEPDARLPADTALAPDRDYTLEVAIRADRLGFGGARTPLKAPRRQQEAITVYARVAARGDLAFEDRLLPLKWPFDSDSTPAFFRFRTGGAVTTATIIEVRLLSADLRLLDQLELARLDGHWQVRAIEAPIAFSRPAGTPARDALALHVTPAGAGYAIDALLTRNGNAPLELPLGQVILPADIAALLAGVRNHWTELVIGPMSTRLELTAGSHNKATTALAALGHQAWRLLFGDGRGSQAGTSEAFARLLVEDPMPPDSIIRITSDDTARGFGFPWTIVAPPGVAPPTGASPQFWGLAYQIEIARKQGRTPPPPEALRITAVVDPGFASFVDHPATLAAVAASGRTATLALPTSRADVGAALAADSPAELFYFFCHGIMGGAAAGLPADIAAVIASAAAKLPADARAPWQRLLEQLAVTDGAGARIFFGTAELSEQALRDTDFFKAGRRPLVFLNMCHSAATAPASRAGLPAIFLDRDAIAVIGTESPINAPFGDAFARELLTRLLGGAPLGAAMLATRRAFDARRNPLALVYTIYGRGDITLAAPMALHKESAG